MAIIGTHALLYTSEPEALGRHFGTYSASSMWTLAKDG